MRHLLRSSIISSKLVCADKNSSGGEEVLLDVGGQDATEAFEDVGHSDEARESLDKLLVGTLKRQVRVFMPQFDDDYVENRTILIATFRPETLCPRAPLPTLPRPPARPTRPPLVSVSTLSSSSVV